MANIGTFKKAGNDYHGEIVTLTLQTNNVRIVSVPNQPNENAPSHRVYVGRAEVGGGWPRQSAEGRDYLSIKIDDPSLSKPIYASLFADDDGDTFSLVWNRSRKSNAD